MDVLLIVSMVGGLVLAYLVFAFNRLVALRQLTRNAWSDISVFLNRRADLIPNIVTAVKAYAQHETTTFEKLARARELATSSRDVPSRSEAEGQITTGLERTLMLAEAYPELKASANFVRLQEELTDTEDKIASARQYYNACVRDLNTRIESFPQSLVAAIGGFRLEAFFEPETHQEREAPRFGS